MAWTNLSEDVTEEFEAPAQRQLYEAYADWSLRRIRARRESDLKSYYEMKVDPERLAEHRSKRQLYMHQYRRLRGVMPKVSKFKPKTVRAKQTPEQRKARKAAWFQKNKEKRNSKQREWYRKNRARVQEMLRAKRSKAQKAPIPEQ